MAGWEAWIRTRINSSKGCCPTIKRLPSLIGLILLKLSRNYHPYLLEGLCYDRIIVMRKIFVLEFMTLDGVIQAPGASKEDAAEGFKYGGWMGPYFEEVGGQEMDKQMKATAALLLGRKTYDIWTGYWPTHTETWPQVNKITK